MGLPSVRGIEHDGDINAATNIKAEAPRQLIHPLDAGAVGAFGGGPQRLPATCGVSPIPKGQGACPVAVAARITQSSSTSQGPLR